MFTYMFDFIFNNTNPKSIASSLRQKRFARLNRFLSHQYQGEVIKLLDIGGDDKYWSMMLDCLNLPVEITLLNIVPHHHINDPRIQAMVGDGRDLSMFSDKSFDVIISNSVIEHVGSFLDQKRMADEVQRVGKGYFIQTPNRYFPIEPHFLIPFFQFFPTGLKVNIAKNFKPGWYYNRKVEAAIEDARTIRLLSKRELRVLFPEGKIWEEKVLGMTKSFIVWHEYS